MKTNKKELGKEQNTKIESEKTENNKSIETDEKNSTTIEGKKPSLDDLSPKSKKFAKIYNAVRFLVIIAAGVALIYASYSLTESYLNYKDDEKKYASLNDMFVQDAKGNTGSDSSAGLNGNKALNNSEVSDSNSTANSTNSNTSNTGSSTTSSNSSSSDTLNYSADSKKWVWNYDAMLKYNDEAKGYIKLDGTRIQYPIFEHSDNKYYLKHGADKIYNGAGAIFIDYRTAGLEGDMCILYGHNMLDGSMFKEIMNFRDKDFCKKHPTFDIYIGRKHYIYYVFSVFSGKDVDEKIYQVLKIKAISRAGLTEFTARVHTSLIQESQRRMIRLLCVQHVWTTMETDSLFVCTEGKKLWIRDFHLILLRKRFKKLDKYSYAIDFCKEMM